MRYVSRTTALVGLLAIAGARPVHAQPTYAHARAGVSLARGAGPAPSSRIADTLRSSPRERIVVIVASGWLWSAGAMLGGALGALGSGACLDVCDPPIETGKGGVLTGMAIGGGATIAISMAGMGGGAYRRCSFGRRLARASAGVAAGSAPGVLHATLDEPNLGSVFLTAAGQLAGSAVALRPCR